MSRSLKNLAAASIFLLAAFLLAACGQNTAYMEAELGEGLPAWQFTEERYAADLPADAAEQGLVAIYAADSDEHADIYIYNYDKEDGVTLADMGEKMAAEYGVFCDTVTNMDVPAVKLAYYENIGGEDYIVGAYLFEGEQKYVKLCSMYKTAQIPLAETDMYISMINGYAETDPADSAFPYEKVYTYGNRYLPTVTVRQFAKDYFTPEVFDASSLSGVTEEQYAAYAEDGWTLEEEIAFYGSRYDLMRGDILQRNGFDLAFIAYVVDDILEVKAVIDCGDDYVMLCAENLRENYQHIVNALIDTIGR